MSATVIMRRFYLAMCMKDNCPSLVRVLEGRKTESMRQISDLLTTRNCDNATTCSFFVSKRWCGQGFRNLPHTSVRRLRKCGKNRDLLTRLRFYASATCGFVVENKVVLGGFRFSPHFRLSGISGAICDAEEQCSRQEQRKEYGDSVAIDGFGKFGWGTVAPS